METRVGGSDRREKYPREVVDRKNKESKTGGEIIVIKDKSQRLKKIKGISIDTSVEGRTTIKFSNRKFVNPFFGVLQREWSELHWIKNYPRSRISTHVKLEDPELEKLENLIKETIKL